MQDYFVEVDIVMDARTPLWKAHDISQQLQDKIEVLPNVERAFVHVDHETTHPPVRDQSKKIHSLLRPAHFSDTHLTGTPKVYMTDHDIQHIDPRCMHQRAASNLSCSGPFVFENYKGHNQAITGYS